PGRYVQPAVGRESGKHGVGERDGTLVTRAGRDETADAHAPTNASMVSSAPFTAGVAAARCTGVCPGTPAAAALTSATTALAVAPPPAPGPRKSTVPSGSPVNSMWLVGPAVTSGWSLGSDTGPTWARHFPATASTLPISLMVRPRPACSANMAA